MKIKLKKLSGKGKKLTDISYPLIDSKLQYELIRGIGEAWKKIDMHNMRKHKIQKASK
jgi:hypothetical protein